MAADPNDNGPTKDDPAKSKDRPSQIWPENQGLVAQQSAANAMFRRNSKMLQERQAGTREEESEDRETQGDGDRSGEQGSPHPLVFVKDGELSYKRETEKQKQESGSKPEREEAEPQPQEPNRRLLFVKDRNPDLSRG